MVERHVANVDVGGEFQELPPERRGHRAVVERQPSKLDVEKSPGGWKKNRGTESPGFAGDLLTIRRLGRKRDHWSRLYRGEASLCQRVETGQLIGGGRGATPAVPEVVHGSPQIVDDHEDARQRNENKHRRAHEAERNADRHRYQELGLKRRLQHQRRQSKDRRDRR